MKQKFLPLLTLSLTLLLGILIGWNGTRWIRACAFYTSSKTTFCKPDSTQVQKKIEDRLMRVINPRESQKKELQPLVIKYSTQMEQHLKNHRQSFNQLMNNLRTDLDTILDSAQMENFLHHQHKFGRMGHGHLRLVGGNP